MIIGITTTLNEADGFQRVNVEYINRVAATGAVPILLTPIAGGAEANREHARRVIDLVDGLLITGGGDVHPRYYVPDPAKNRDALGLDDLAAMGCGSSSHCRSTGAKVPFCGHYVPDRTFEEAAALAAYYSGARGSEKAEVDYIEKKHVKKPAGARPGFVVYYTNYSMSIGTDISGIQLLES